jgi:hydrogenase maturation factor HypE
VAVPANYLAAVAPQGIDEQLTLALLSAAPFVVITIAEGGGGATIAGGALGAVTFAYVAEQFALAA